MRSFNYFQSTEIIFGKGRIKELGDIVSGLGKNVLLVTTHASNQALSEQYEKVISIMKKCGLKVSHFDGVVPNPTIESISLGAKLAVDSNAEIIVGLGGGSAMDSAKAISVEATHEGISWDYLFYKNQPDPAKLLPVIAVSTTSGTGSHVTQVAVVTNTEEKDKSALYNNILYPKVCIVDPELMLTVPEFVTATTGFDVFCHAFESFIHPGAGHYIDLLAMEAISIVIENLPGLLDDPVDIERREKMAWADTIAGLCIANAGVTLPHGMGMAIGGMYPHVAHAEALAIVYPEFCKFSWNSAISQFAYLAKTLNPMLVNLNDEDAASFATEEIIKFIKKLNLYKGLKDIDMPEEEIESLAKQCMVLPDYKNNPKVANIDDMRKLITNSYSL